MGFFFDGVRLVHIQQGRSQGHILEDRILGEKIKVLENQTKVEPVLPNLFFRLTKKLFPVYIDLTAVRGFQKVQTPKQGGFTAAGRTDDRQDLSFFQREGHIFQNLVGTEILF